MARRNLLKLGEPLLRKKSKPVTNFDGRLGELLDDMAETMKAYEGMGLAAVQVGVLKRAYIVEADKKIYEIINPEIVKTNGELIDVEGCLSVEGYRGIVARPEKVTLNYFDRNGVAMTLDAEGYTARAFLHEYDHLDGVLFPDKMIRKATDEDVKE
ncbi:MAG TPA: peptide deformylase [Eubacteriales bacterium]|nr:peptide deformylase [Eubacteriales bacterium]